MPRSSIKVGRYNILNLKSDGRDSDDQRATLLKQFSAVCGLASNRGRPSNVNSEVGVGKL